MPLLFPFVPRKGAPLPIPMERVVSPAHHEPARSVCEHPRPLSPTSCGCVSLGQGPGRWGPRDRAELGQGHLQSCLELPGTPRAHPREQAGATQLHLDPHRPSPGTQHPPGSGVRKETVKVVSASV